MGRPLLAESCFGLAACDAACDEHSQRVDRSHDGVRMGQTPDGADAVDESAQQGQECKSHPFEDLVEPVGQPVRPALLLDCVIGHICHLLSSGVLLRPGSGWGDAEPGGDPGECVSSLHGHGPSSAASTAAGGETLAGMDDVGRADAVESGDGGPAAAEDGAQAVAGTHHIGAVPCASARVASQTFVDHGHDLVVPVTQEGVPLRVVAVLAADHRRGETAHVADRRTLGRRGSRRDRIGLRAYRSVGIARPGGRIPIKPVDIHGVAHAGHMPRGGVLPGGGERPRCHRVGRCPRIPQAFAGIASRVAGHPEPVVGPGHSPPVTRADRGR